MTRYVCIHGHFYQPPRENAWLEEVESQDSAYPYHDWNERIAAECYAPNTASRILGPGNAIVDIINNFSRISFNVGPTLLSWMQRHSPEVYAAVIDADRLSAERFSGHGSAVAQVYNHMIMPLASRRDKVTQALWGITDFTRRFGRAPEGMWLPETAVDIETLEVLAGLDIRFTILAPRQAKRVKALTRGARWHDVEGGRIDPTIPYVCRLPSGASIVLFFYDGPVSQDLAFAGLLNNGEAFAQRLIRAFGTGDGKGRLVHVATDGETYGHHHRYGDMALSYCLHRIESIPDVRLTNYGEFLDVHPPDQQVEIFENSSWSCIHGIERWRSDCGCSSGSRPGWNQAWRKPLREAIDGLRDALAGPFEEVTRGLLRDPWAARDAYYELVADRSAAVRAEYLARHSVRTLSAEETVRVLQALEMQRHCMLMYTSCAWFFDEISGIETTQVLQYAAMAMQYATLLTGAPVEERFLATLAGAPSNVLENGAAVYHRYVLPARLDLLRVCAHYAIASLFEEDPSLVNLYCYRVETSEYRKLEAGRFRLVLGNARVSSSLTLDARQITFALLHLGDHNLSGGVREYQGADLYAQMRDDVSGAFLRGDVPQVMKLILVHFETNNYSLWHLFKDQQRKVLKVILEEKLGQVEAVLQEIYDENYPIMTFLQNLQTPVPQPLLLAADHVVNAGFRRLFQNSTIDVARLDLLIGQARRWSFRLDTEMFRFVATEWLNRSMGVLRGNPADTPLMENIVRVLTALKPLAIEIDLWTAQNVYFAIGRGELPAARARAARSEESASEWLRRFAALGTHLQVKVE